MLKLTDTRNFKKPFILLSKIKNYFKLKKEFKKFKKLSDEVGARFPVKWENIFFISGDSTNNTEFDAHYVYHPAWAARILEKTKPQKHIDISSTLHFCSIVSAFIPIDFYDYRPAFLNLSNLNSKRGDLTSLPFEDSSVESISCMHAIEHIGLGRYGDPLDPDGDLKAIKELKRVTAKDGSLIFVVPVRQPKIMFNAHRIYSYNQVIGYFDDFELKQFALIPDNATISGIILEATKNQADKQGYGCGCFWFQKK